MATDALGNLYFADGNNNAIKEWSPASSQVVTLVSSGLKIPSGIAVDGQGNVYIADFGNNAVKQWSPANQQVTTLVSSQLNGPLGVAVDAQGSVYVADTVNSIIRKLSFGYLSLPASRSEGPQAGTDSVTAQVLPANMPFTVSSDQPWLKITGLANGVIGFSFQANTSVASRAAHITVLGQQVAVTQTGDTPASISKIAGAGQSTPVQQAFATALQVRVKDAAGNGVSGAPVTFTVTPDATGASGTFNTSPSMPILTNASGFATAPVLNANNITGTFTVTASVGGLTTIFGLTITAQ